MFKKSLITESRQASALKKELTPVKIDRDAGSAVFVGSEGNLYETTLDACSCPDFAIQGYEQPCKHMIRLAMEVGELPSDGMQSDIDAVRVKYYLGCARGFIHSADIRELIPFVKDYMSLVNDGILPVDDAFKQSMDLNTLSDLHCFKPAKNGKIKIDKAYTKEFDNLVTVIRNRFGNEVIARLDDDAFITILCQNE